MAATKPKPLRRVSLTEYVSRGLLRLADGAARVDRDRGVVRGVKVLGQDSTNSRKYLPEAIKKAAPLYEGKSVRIDHFKKKGEDRPSEEVFGWLENVRPEADGCLYADLHYLKSHPMADRVAEAAERNHLLFGLSHDASGEGEPQNGVFVVQEITEVRSVDLVADPATNKGLFESRGEKMVQVQANKFLLEKCLHALAAGRRRLLESVCEALPDDRLMEADEGGDYRDHLHAAKKMCEDAGDTETAGKIHKLMKPAKEEGEEELHEDELDDEDGDADPSDKGKAEESAKKKPAAGFALTEARARDLCDLASVELTESLKKTLAACATEREALLEIRLAQAKKGGAPAPASRGAQSRSLHTLQGANQQQTEKQLQESRQQQWARFEHVN